MAPRGHGEAADTSAKNIPSAAGPRVLDHERDGLSHGVDDGIGPVRGLCPDVIPHLGRVGAEGCGIRDAEYAFRNSVSPRMTVVRDGRGLRA